jgi:catechol 2,3-dioxygenase-like lactoylglutathione lyase family enzyme
MNTAHFILYVPDQEASTRFYSRTLDLKPRLNVPGMTQFDLPGGAVLGLMPEAGVKRLLGDALPDPPFAAGTPRSELYLIVDDASDYLRRALSGGARQLSPILPRNWGHDAGYVLDPDGHVLGFAHVHQSG